MTTKDMQRFPLIGDCMRDYLADFADLAINNIKSRYGYGYLYR